MCQSLETLVVSNILTLKKIFWKTKTFFKKLEYRFFFVESTKLENATIPCKMYGPITKNEILPVTTLFFRTFCFSLRISYKELIWCTKYPNFNIHTFRKRWSFPVSMLECPITMKHSDVNWEEPVSLNLLINDNLTKVTKA